MPRPRRYYSLIVREDDGRFYVDFGGYDKDVVKAEFQGKRDHGVHRSDLAIIAHRDSSLAQVNAVQQYNAKHATN